MKLNKPLAMAVAVLFIGGWVLGLVAFYPRLVGLIIWLALLALAFSGVLDEWLNRLTGHRWKAPW